MVQSCDPSLEQRNEQITQEDWHDDVKDKLRL